MEILNWDMFRSSYFRLLFLKKKLMTISKINNDDELVGKFIDYLYG